MDEPIASDIDVEFEATPSEVLELNHEWIAFLEAQPLTAEMDGVDADIAYLTGDFSSQDQTGMA